MVVISLCRVLRAVILKPVIDLNTVIGLITAWWMLVLMSRRLCDSACACLHLSWLTAQFMIINLQSGTACLSLLIYICWPLFSVLVSDLIKEKHYADGSDCVLVGQAARWERLERLAR